MYDREIVMDSLQKISKAICTASPHFERFL